MSSPVGHHYAFMDYQVPQAVLDSRIKTRRYGQLFLRSLPPMPKTADLNQVRAFFMRNRG